MVLLSMLTADIINRMETRGYTSHRNIYNIVLVRFDCRDERWIETQNCNKQIRRLLIENMKILNKVFGVAKVLTRIL